MRDIQAESMRLQRQARVLVGRLYLTQLCYVFGGLFQKQSTKLAVALYAFAKAGKSPGWPFVSDAALLCVRGSVSKAVYKTRRGSVLTHSLPAI